MGGGNSRDGSMPNAGTLNSDLVSTWNTLCKSHFIPPSHSSSPLTFIFIIHEDVWQNQWQCGSRWSDASPAPPSVKTAPVRYDGTWLVCTYAKDTAESYIYIAMYDQV